MQKRLCATARCWLDDAAWTTTRFAERALETARVGTLPARTSEMAVRLITEELDSYSYLLWTRRVRCGGSTRPAPPPGARYNRNETPKDRDVGKPIRSVSDASFEKW